MYDGEVARQGAPTGNDTARRFEAFAVAENLRRRRRRHQGHAEAVAQAVRRDISSKALPVQMHARRLVRVEAGVVARGRVGGGEEGRALLNWDEAEKLPWGVLILFGGEIVTGDHIIPRSVCPELDNALYNLEMMPLTLNQKKSAKIGQRQIDLAKRWNADGLLSDEGLKGVLEEGKDN